MTHYNIIAKEVQHRIVTILDPFESSIANLEARLKEREKAMWALS